MQKKGRQVSSYDVTLRNQIVMVALLYKIQNDPYYRDVQFDSNAVQDLPENATESHIWLTLLLYPILTMT